MSWILSILLAGFAAGSAVDTEFTKLAPPADQATPTTVTATVIQPPASDDKIDQTFPLSKNGRVAVSNVNGSITIATWDRDEVRVQAVKVADDASRLPDVSVEISARPDSIAIETVYSKSATQNYDYKKYGKLNVDYVLTVPRSVSLDEIETVNGEVVVSDVTGKTTISAVNGKITTRNLGGTASLSTVNGKIDATFDTIAADARIELETVNGQVALTLPSDTNAVLNADTVNGRIENDFGLRVKKGQYVGRNLNGRLGSGEANISLSAVNGGLIIRRQTDGRNPSSVVDLTPAKSDESGTIEAPRPPLPPDVEPAMEEAMRIAQKEIEKAMKTSEKAMKEAEREMAKVDKERLRKELDEAMRRTNDVAAQFPASVNVPAFSTAETISESFTVNQPMSVNIDARSCAVNVRGWDRNEIKYNITRMSGSRSGQKIDLTVDKSESKFTLRIPEANGGRSGERIRIDIFVPRKSSLRVSTERELRVENISGDIDLKGFGESIDVRDADGTLRVSSANGRIRVIGFRGEVTTENSDGEMLLEGDFTKLDARTADGNIIVTLPENTSATLRATTDVEFSGFRSERQATGNDSRVWKIGDGKADLKFATADGRVFVRSASALQ